MESERVERVAAAIFREWRGTAPSLPWSDIPEAGRELGRDLARAAIAAMWEPTDPEDTGLEAMIDASLANSFPPWRVGDDP